MDIHISTQVIKEIISVIGYVVIGGVFGAGFIWNSRTGEKISMVVMGIFFAVVWRFLMKLIFGG